MSVTFKNVTIEELKQEITVNQYAEVSRVYDLSIGSIDQRTDEYKRFFGDILKQHGCVTVLDTSCGTGIDSTLLLEQGFKVVSVDASKEMLEHARKLKLEKSHDPTYQNWVIKQANWTTLPEDIESFLPGFKFDAVVCLCNSFPHVFDPDGDRALQKKCLRSFQKCLKPGGVLLIDHRNYDSVVKGAPIPVFNNAYYKYKHPMEVSSEVLVVDKPEMIITRYKPKSREQNDNAIITQCNRDKIGWHEFSLQLPTMTKMLEETFENRTKYKIYGDFKPLGQVPCPGFYLHVIQTT